MSRVYSSINYSVQVKETNKQTQIIHKGDNPIEWYKTGITQLYGITQNVIRCSIKGD